MDYSKLTVKDLKELLRNNELKVSGNKSDLIERLTSFDKKQALELKTSIVKESKVEEPKVKESKVKESKVKEPKVKEPKVKESKVEEPKVKESKVKESKVKEPKVKESKVEDEEQGDNKKLLTFDDNFFDINDKTPYNLNMEPIFSLELSEDGVIIESYMGYNNGDNEYDYQLKDTIYLTNEVAQLMFNDIDHKYNVRMYSNKYHKLVQGTYDNVLIVDLFKYVNNKFYSERFHER